MFGARSRTHIHTHTCTTTYERVHMHAHTQRPQTWGDPLMQWRGIQPKLEESINRLATEATREQGGPRERHKDIDGTPSTARQTHHEARHTWQEEAVHTTHGPEWRVERSEECRMQRLKQNRSIHHPRRTLSVCIMRRREKRTSETQNNKNTSQTRDELRWLYAVLYVC